MIKRGRILRDTSAGPGLLVADGQQYTFPLEGAWRSVEAPRVGMMADVDFNERGDIVAVTAVPDAQIAREQTEAAMNAARERGAALASGAVAKFGAPALIAAACLLVGWFLLPAASVTVPFAGSIHVTFWQVLGVLNSGSPEAIVTHSGASTGIYGLLAVIAIVGPFVHHFWKDRRALLGGVLPLVFMLLVALMVRHALSSAFGGADPTGGALGDFQQEARNAVSSAISIGAGAYLALLASLYFAAISVRTYLATGATQSLVKAVKA
jgi:hypothetical protein